MLTLYLPGSHFVVLRPLVHEVDEVPGPVLDVGVLLVEVLLDGEPVVVGRRAEAAEEPDPALVNDLPVGDHLQAVEVVRVGEYEQGVD